MLFSVVIPTFNRRGLLQQTLASVWAQTCTDYEVIVVDNGSTDGTRDDLLAAGARLVAVFLSTAGGPGAARNAGAARARGRYIAFLDSDDLWFPWTLATMKECIEVHGAPAILGGKIHEFLENEELRAVTPQPAVGRRHADFIASAAAKVLIGSGSTVVRADVMRDSGGFTPRHVNGEDLDWLLRLGTVPGFVEVQSPPTLAWRRHVGSATATLSLNVAGACFLIAQERSGQYPGGAERAGERRTILGRTVRPISVACVQAGWVGQGLRIYAATFLWHLRLLRLRYLIGLPLSALGQLVRPVRRTT